MKAMQYELDFITPAFLAGADQGVAELRVASIRGALRWWFRVLGGTKEEETEVFGGVHDGTTRSRVIVRTEVVQRGGDWELPTFSPNDPSSYVWHFAKESGKGKRWASAGVLSPGTRWRLSILQRGACSQKFEEALKCFLVFGSLGLRATRGLGAFVLRNPIDCSVDDVKGIIQRAGFKVEEKEISKASFAETIGSFVKGTREKQSWRNDSKNHRETPSPMGTSSSPRQTSAIRFRPVEMDDGHWRLVVFSPPYERVLGEVSRIGKAIVVGCNPSKLVFAKVENRGRR